MHVKEMIKDDPAMIRFLYLSIGKGLIIRNVLKIYFAIVPAKA